MVCSTWVVMQAHVEWGGGVTPHAGEVSPAALRVHVPAQTHTRGLPPAIALQAERILKVLVWCSAFKRFLAHGARLLGGGGAGELQVTRVCRKDTAD